MKRHSKMIQLKGQMEARTPRTRAIAKSLFRAAIKAIPGLTVFSSALLIPLALANPAPQAIAGFQTPNELPVGKETVSLHQMIRDERWTTNRNLCDAGSTDACYRAGKTALYGRQYVSAFRLFLRGCKSGNLDSCLAIQFSSKSGVSSSVRETWIRRTISSLEESCPGDVTACANLGNILVYRNVEEALPHLESACSEGHLKSCNGLQALRQAERQKDGLRIEAPSF